MKNTLITLKYVDASNYKKSIDYVLKGEITDEQLNEIAEHLEDGECIIAEEIGLPTPALQFAENYDFPTEDDHVFTTIQEFQSGIPSAESLHTDLPPTDPNYTVDDFYTRIIESNGWDITREYERLGM